MLWTAAGVRRLRKEEPRPESKLAGKRRGWGGRFLFAGRGFGTHNLGGLSVIIALGLKKRKTVLPSVPPDVTMELFFIGTGGKKC